MDAACMPPARADMQELQRLGAPEAMPFHHMHLPKRSQRQSLQLLPITLQ
jgi:hypothetical protein